MGESGFSPPSSAPERRRDVQVQALQPDGDEIGEATYAMQIKPGEEIIGDKNQHFSVRDVVVYD